jgi:hypothetical protein
MSVVGRNVIPTLAAALVWSIVAKIVLPPSVIAFVSFAIVSQYE